MVKTFFIVLWKLCSQHYGEVIIIDEPNTEKSASAFYCVGFEYLVPLVSVTDEIVITE